MSERLKTYTFASSTSTSASNGAVAAQYSSFPIVGEIVKISYKGGNYGANGSLFIFTSGGNLGPDEQIFKKNGIGATDAVWYPAVSKVEMDTTAIGDGSGNIWTGYLVDNKIWFGASGAGDTKVFSGLTIFYR